MFFNGSGLFTLANDHDQDFLVAIFFKHVTNETILVGANLCCSDRYLRTLHIKNDWMQRSNANQMAKSPSAHVNLSLSL